MTTPTIMPKPALRPLLLELFELEVVPKSWTSICSTRRSPELPLGLLECVRFRTRSMSLQGRKRT
jgi:hypothetical protein